MESFENGYRMKHKLIITDETLECEGKEKKEFHAAALYDGKRLLDIHLQTAEETKDNILNRIYVARVNRVVKNLNAAFVEIQKGVLCYLSLEDIHHPIFTHKYSKKQPMAAGDELVVQVSKEAMKTKSPVATTNLSFAGQYLVLTTGNRRIGISSKVGKEACLRLQDMAEGLLPEDAPFGLICRTNAAEAAEDAVREEYRQLFQEYQALVSAAHTRTIYSCLWKEPPFYKKIWQDLPKQQLEEVVTDKKEVFEELNSLGDACPVRLYEDSQLPLARLYNISGQVEKALKERVWLKSGANIIIQPTEALTVIDVNSGKNIAKKDKLLNHYRINVEAAEEIALQLRLRNISGIIIIDFIDLEEEGLNASLLAALRNAVKTDPIPTQVLDMTKLGLVELTRKKIRKSLKELLKNT